MASILEKSSTIYASFKLSVHSRNTNNTISNFECYQNDRTSKKPNKLKEDSRQHQISRWDIVILGFIPSHHTYTN